MQYEAPAADGSIGQQIYLVGKGITYDTGGADVKVSHAPSAPVHCLSRLVLQSARVATRGYACASAGARTQPIMPSAWPPACLCLR